MKEQGEKISCDHRLRRELRRARRRRRHRRRAGRRFARHGDPGARHDGAGHARAHHLSLPRRGEGPVPPVPDGRHAVHDLHLEGAGAAERRAADAGRRRQDGQARRRRGPGRDRRVPREPRHRGLRAPRPAGRSRCTRPAAFACRAAKRRRPSRCAATPRRCRTPAPTSCCSNAFRRALGAEITRRAARAGDRHRRRARHRRPDPRALRRARHHAGSQAALRAEFHDGPRQPARRLAGLHAGRQDAGVSRRPNTVSDAPPTTVTRSRLEDANPHADRGTARTRHRLAPRPRAHRVRADDGQPAHGSREPDGRGASARPARHRRACSSIRCSSARARISRPIRARPTTMRACSTNTASMRCSTRASTRCIRRAAVGSTVVRRAGARRTSCAARFGPGISRASRRSS